MKNKYNNYINIIATIIILAIATALSIIINNLSLV